MFCYTAPEHQLTHVVGKYGNNRRIVYGLLESVNVKGNTVLVQIIVSKADGPARDDGQIHKRGNPHKTETEVWAILDLISMSPSVSHARSLNWFIMPP